MTESPLDRPTPHPAVGRRGADRYPRPAEPRRKFVPGDHDVHPTRTQAPCGVDWHLRICVHRRRRRGHCRPGCRFARYRRNCLRPWLDHHGLRLRVSRGIGGHFNPAVTIGVLTAGAMRAGEAIGYIMSQLVGGVIGALLLAAVLGGTATGLGTPALAHDLALGHTTVRITLAIGRDRDGARLFSGHRRARHCGRGPRRQPRAAGDRRVLDPQHHDGGPCAFGPA